MPLMSCLICGAQIERFGQDHIHDPETSNLVPQIAGQAPFWSTADYEAYVASAPAEETPAEEPTPEPEPAPVEEPTTSFGTFGGVTS